MRLALAALLLLFALGHARAEDAVLPPADRDAIRATIQTQLDAFRRDDARGAYAEAAPGIRDLFPTPDIFLEMVRRGYPPVYRPRSTEFTGLVMENGQLVQQVEIVGPDGMPHLALYTMVKQPDGSWRIAGCAIAASARVGV